MTTQAQPKKFSTGVVIAAIIAMVLLAAIPLAIVKDTEFGGSDGAGSELVEELAPDYDTGWISNIWEPPGGETESMLFALQAVAGGILIGYLFGYKRAEQKLT
jgi:cobalt/nickel transport protein